MLSSTNDIGSAYAYHRNKVTENKNNKASLDNMTMKMPSKEESVLAFRKASAQIEWGALFLV